MSESKSAVTKRKSSKKISDLELPDAYLEQLDSIHKKAYLIAKEHLETSFDLEKSIGYKEWLANIKQEKC